MKNFKFIIGVCLLISFQAFAQINPVQNLTWDQWYDFPNNYFILEWDEPESPHGDLIGYNVYQEDELFRFQTETSLFNLPEESNCDVLFLLYNEGGPFYVHVTAVYNPGEVESDYTETVLVKGAALGTNDFIKEKPILYPNPTNGNVTINISNPLNIEIYNLTGKLLNSYQNSSQIDVSFLTKGVYLIKLVSNKGTTVEKLIVT